MLSAYVLLCCAAIYAMLWGSMKLWKELDPVGMHIEVKTPSIRVALLGVLSAAVIAVGFVSLFITLWAVI